MIAAGQPDVEARSWRGSWTPEQQPCDFPERHNQVHRDTEVHRHRRYRQKEPDDDRDHIPDHHGQEFSPRALDLIAVPLRRVEVLAPRIRIQGGPQERGSPAGSARRP